MLGTQEVPIEIVLKRLIPLLKKPILFLEILNLPFEMLNKLALRVQLGLNLVEMAIDVPEMRLKLLLQPCVDRCAVVFQQLLKHGEIGCRGTPHCSTGGFERGGL